MDEATRAALRGLPGVDRLLAAPPWTQRARHVPANLRRDACRAVLDAARLAIRGGAPGPSFEALLEEALRRSLGDARPALRSVVNATGVVLHTNLGRAPLSAAALAALSAAGGYVNLEMDTDSGVRDHRMDRLAASFARVLGCGDVVVTNNNASAVFLTLSALGEGRGCVVSRGELVEIGGSFRMPDIMERSGTRLVEVGTTNRTHAADYERALASGAELVLKVHRSNFELVGFTREASLAELAPLCRAAGAPLLYDFGAGLLRGKLGAAEHSVKQALGDGADLVLFSGDKLLGGPQCGIVAGSAELVQRVRKHPLMRMLRPGKLTLLALEATLLAWERAPDGAEIPAAVLAQRSPGSLQLVAERLADVLRPLVGDAAAVDVVPVESATGGGSHPLWTLPSRAVRLRPSVTSEEALAAALRQGEPCVVGRREDGAVLLDVRTLLDGDEQRVVQAVRRWRQGAVG